MKGAAQAICKKSTVKGFTLIEVMVALVIVSVALPTLLMQMSGMANTAFHAERSMLAHWVAENKMQEVLLAKRIRNIIPSGRTAGDIEMADVKWDWVVESEDVEGGLNLPGAPKLKRIWVRISAQGDDNVLAEISGFMLE